MYIYFVSIIEVVCLKYSQGLLKGNKALQGSRNLKKKKKSWYIVTECCWLCCTESFNGFLLSVKLNAFSSSPHWASPCTGAVFQLSWCVQEQIQCCSINTLWLGLFPQVFSFQLTLVSAFGNFIYTDGLISRPFSEKPYLMRPTRGKLALLWPLVPNALTPIPLSNYCPSCLQLPLSSSKTVKFLTCSSAKKEFILTKLKTYIKCLTVYFVF